jgi:hypothetical protein
VFLLRAVAKSVAAAKQAWQTPVCFQIQEQASATKYFPGTVTSANGLLQPKMKWFNLIAHSLVKPRMPA